MSTSKPFTYPVTVVAYREPDKYTGGRCRTVREQPLLQLDYSA